MTVISKIQIVHNNKITSAFRKFDKKYRNDFKYNGNHEYAVWWYDCLYPIKAIVRLAVKNSLEIWNPDFSGSESKHYLMKKKFTILELPDLQYRSENKLSLRFVFKDSYTYDEVLLNKNGVRLINDISENQTNANMQTAMEKANSAWVFQWNPDGHDTFDDFASGKKTEPWRVNAHWLLMEKDDIALLWKTANGDGDSHGEAGIYAIGRLTDSPYKAPSNDMCKYRVIVEYLFVLPVPIIKSALQGHPQLSTLANRIKRGSNYQVKDAEWGELKIKIYNDISVYVSRQNGIPHRKSVQTLNYDRDSKLVKEIKQKVQHKCQICNQVISLGDNIYYSEGHHIKPLGNNHNGVDDEDNIIILCPNHHKEFDYGSIAIDPDNGGVIHIDKKNLYNDKRLAYKRHLNSEYLLYHFQNIFKKYCH